VLGGRGGAVAWRGDGCDLLAPHASWCRADVSERVGREWALGCRRGRHGGWRSGRADRSDARRSGGDGFGGRVESARVVQAPESGMAGTIRIEPGWTSEGALEVWRMTAGGVVVARSELGEGGPGEYSGCLLGRGCESGVLLACSTRCWTCWRLLTVGVRPKELAGFRRGKTVKRPRGGRRGKRVSSCGSVHVARRGDVPVVPRVEPVSVRWVDYVAGFGDFVLTECGDGCDRGVETLWTQCGRY